MYQYKRYQDISNEIIQLMSTPDRNVGESLGRFLQEKGEQVTYIIEDDKYYVNSFLPSFPSEAWNRLSSSINAIGAMEKRIPIQCDIVVTGACHCACWHCFRKGYKEGNLSKEIIIEIMNSLKEMGTSTVGITGGEPMLREDILDIINLIPDGIEGQLYTTGHLIDEVFVKSLKKTNLTRCIISLDHFDSHQAGELRMYKDAHSEAVSAINLMVKNGIYTAVTMCVTENLLENNGIEDYFEFLKDIGVHEIRVVMQIPQGAIKEKKVGRIYGTAIRHVRRLRKAYREKTGYPVVVNFCEIESSNYFGCGAGVNYISINNDGALTPCVAVPLGFGNVYDSPLKELFMDMEAYFPTTNGSCYGIASSSIMNKNDIAKNNKPFNHEASIDVAKQCNFKNEQASIFNAVHLGVLNS